MASFICANPTQYEARERAEVSLQGGKAARAAATARPMRMESAAGGSTSIHSSGGSKVQRSLSCRAWLDPSHTAAKLDLGGITPIADEGW